ncbi:hypothetical protein DERP_000688 [Dermatophagoides pteronyssinus]|uniref:Uncharacterized protein n=1 Tax=Dermatophagoides pteronyssinus TaxID=6956 RepID=A0ABQ8J1E2_DERPT|nr:hypothetical protein DERP_000688 [Dermatophagoides pteronyssinus]
MSNVYTTTTIDDDQMDQECFWSRSMDNNIKTK